MRQYEVAFDDDEGLVTDDGGGFDIVSADEDLAVELFRAWWRAKRAEQDHRERVEARRATMHLVGIDRP